MEMHQLMQLKGLAALPIDTIKVLMLSSRIQRVEFCFATAIIGNVIDCLFCVLKTHGRVINVVFSVSSSSLFNLLVYSVIEIDKLDVVQYVIIVVVVATLVLIVLCNVL